MKAYEDLTRRGKLQRLNRVAHAVLRLYGFTDAKLQLMAAAGNVTYRVNATESTSMKGDLYAANTYSLRLHAPGYQNDGAVDSELEWIDALSKSGLPVPQPMLTKSGERSVKIPVPGAPMMRRCSLLRWVRGRMVTKNVHPWHMREIGRLMARLHNHSSRWKPSTSFTRRHYDPNGLWGNDTGVLETRDEVWSRIPKKYFEEFKEITTRAEQVMDDWGKGPDVYGLIHADLGTKANVLFHCGEARAIDFDDAGYGYWAYDLACTLSDWEGDDRWPAFRDALLGGYREVRSLPDEILKQLELFQAAWRAVEIFWGTAGTIQNPGSVYWKERRDMAWKLLKRYLKRNPRM